MHLSIFRALLLIASLAAQPQNPAAPQGSRDIAAFMEGASLNQDQVSGLEKTLAGSPDDLNTRLKLLGHYNMTKNGDGKNGDPNFAKHLLWLVDHHPENVVFEVGVIQLGWQPSPAFVNEYAKHWKQAAAAHPRDSAVLSHAAQAVSMNDSSLGLEYARASVKADAGCTRCRNFLGFLIGSAILRLTGYPEQCLPNTPEVQQSVSSLRKEIESSSDPETVLDAGMTIKGYSGLYGSRCGGDSAEAVHLGGELIRKAVTLDPSLIDRRHLQDVMKSIR